MNVRRGGLGRGLGALIPSEPPTERRAGDDRPSIVDGGPALEAPASAHFAEVPIDAIAPNPRQPRTVFDEDALGELVHSALPGAGFLRQVGHRQRCVQDVLDPA